MIKILKRGSAYAETRVAGFFSVHFTKTGQIYQTIKKYNK
jgi:hypothetical protein